MANDFPASFYKEPHLRPETLAVLARINAFIESSRHGTRDATSSKKMGGGASSNMRGIICPP